MVSNLCLDPAGKGGGLRFADFMIFFSSVLGRLPVVRAGDMGTIPHKYRAGLRSGAHRFDHDLARADSGPGRWDGCPMYFVNSWALGWSRDM